MERISNSVDYNGRNSVPNNPSTLIDGGGNKFYFWAENTTDETQSVIRYRVENQNGTFNEIKQIDLGYGIKATSPSVVQSGSDIILSVQAIDRLNPDKWDIRKEVLSDLAVPFVPSPPEPNPPSNNYRYYLPLICRNAYGGWNTGVNVTNCSNSSNNMTVRYYNDSGKKVLEQIKILSPHASWHSFIGDGKLPDGFSGSAEVISIYPLAVVVNETGPDNAAMSYNGVTI